MVVVANAVTGLMRIAMLGAPPLQLVLPARAGACAETAGARRACQAERYVHHQCQWPAALATGALPVAVLEAVALAAAAGAVVRVVAAGVPQKPPQLLHGHSFLAIFQRQRRWQLHETGLSDPTRGQARNRRRAPA